MHNDEFITVAEAAEVLEVSRNTIRRRIRTGEIKAELRPSTYGKQYYINPMELTGAVRNVNVVKIERITTPEELTRLFKLAVQDALIPLQKELKETKTMLESKIKEQIAERIRQIQNEKALKQEIACLHASIETFAAKFQDTVKTIEARQDACLSTHNSLVDDYLTQLSAEAKKGFWAKLSRK